MFIWKTPKINSINLGSFIDMDQSYKFTNFNIPIINLVKYLLIAASFTLATEVFADVKQDVIDACADAINVDDFDSAFPNCTQAAEQGDANAQFNVGLMYSNGEVTTTNDKQAIFWFTNAAKQGHVDAQYNLGVIYAGGNGSPKDDRKTVYWYTKAATQGHTKAQHDLGLMYAFGDGTPKNYQQALYWYTQAAKLGNSSSQFNLALIYANGNGVQKDYKQARYWYSKAAYYGRANAQYNLGVIYAQGEGTPKDFVLAYTWFNIAAAQSDKNSIKARATIRTKMTSNQIVEAQELSKAISRFIINYQI